MSVVGTAKIVTNEGDGKYTITQIYLDTSDDTFKDGTVGLVAVEAWDVNLDETRAVDDKVIFQMQDSHDGKFAPIIAGSLHASDGEGAGSSPIQFERWYDIQANQAYTDVDIRNWSGRFVEVVLLHDGGAPVDGGSWDEQFAEHKESFFGAWTAQEQFKWFRLYLSSSVAFAQDISRVDSGGTDFNLQMAATTGRLQVRVTNFAVRTSVRIWVRGSARITASGAEAIT